MTPAERDEADRLAARARVLSRVLGVGALACGGVAIWSGVAARNVHPADMGGVVESMGLMAVALVAGALALLLGVIAASYWASSR